MIGGWNIVLVTLLAFSRHSQNRKRFIKLLDSEQKLYWQGEPPIATLTWFHGDYRTVQSHFEIRQRAILRRNPWLRGRLVWRWRNGWGMEYDDDDDTCNEAHCLESFQPIQVVPDSVLTRDTPLPDLYALTSKYIVQTNYHNDPLWKVVVIPCRNGPDQHFAVLCSISHVVADGYVYYQLLHSLFSANDKDDDIEASSIPIFDMEPVPNSSQLIRDRIGQAEWDFLQSPWQLLKGALGMVEAKLVRPLLFHQEGNTERWYLLDRQQLEQYKKSIPLPDTVDFVSTNDVLVHWFFTHSGCTLGANLVNYRNRIPRHHRRLGRNYWGAILYNPADFETPSLIRQSLTTLRRSVTKSLPSKWDFLTHGKIAVASGWHTFATDSQLPGGCMEEFHCPILDFASYCPTDTVVMRTFQANSDCIGMYLAGDARMMKGLTHPPGCKQSTLTL